MKVRLLTTQSSYEMDQLSKACEVMGFDWQCDDYRQIGGSLKEIQEYIEGLSQTDWVVSRISTSINDLSAAQLRAILVLVASKVGYHFLNGETYNFYPQMNKFLQMSILYRKGIAIPKTSYNQKVTAIRRYPTIIKGIMGNNGQEVWLAESENEAKKIIKNVGKGRYLLQEYLAGKEDYRVLVLGGEAIASMKKVAKSGFITNIAAGGQATKVEKLRQEEINKLAIKAAQALAVEFGGVDVMYNQEGRPCVLEVNRSAGWEGIEEFSGINVAKKIVEYLNNKR